MRCCAMHCELGKAENCPLLQGCSVLRAHLVRGVRAAVVLSPRAAQVVPQARRRDALALPIHWTAGVAACSNST